MNKRDDADSKIMNIKIKSVQKSNGGKNTTLAGNQGDVSTFDIQNIKIENLNLLFYEKNTHQLENMQFPVSPNLEACHVALGTQESFLSMAISIWQIGRKCVAELGETSNYYEAIAKYAEHSQSIDMCMKVVRIGFSG